MKYKSIFTQRLIKTASLLVACLMSQATYANGPTEPANLRAKVYSSDSAEIFWDRSSDDGTVVGYQLMINGYQYPIFDQLSFLADNLENGERNTVLVTAIDNDGNRTNSKPYFFVSRFAQTSNTSARKVESPTGFRSVVYSNTAVEVFWDRVVGKVRSYIVTVNGEIRSITNGVSMFIDGLRTGENHTIEVIAVDNGNQSERVALDVTTNNVFAQARPIRDDYAGTVSTNPIPVGNSYSAFEPATDDIKPNRTPFQEDGYGTLNVIRVDLRTVTQKGRCLPDDISGCTLDDVLNDTDKRDDLKVDINVHFKADDFADDGSTYNATLRQRGGGSRFADQKSFRIKLEDKNNLWRNERFLQLNKHPFESDRMRNKLAMDLMSQVPHLPSFRTQFVNLWIDDGNGPKDYGLFTHVERANKAYLTSRGLDKKGNLYKASDFRFAKTDLIDMRITSSGKPINKDAFETRLEIEEGNDHRAVHNMMNALHDSNKSFESVLDTYFNRSNVLAWMATNILLKQNDATRHNYILYNPPGTQKFYFLPWDYDATMAKWELPANNSFSNDDMRQRLGYGYALASENYFVEKFYRLPGIHTQLLDATKILRRNHLNNSRITEMSNRNAKLVAPFQMLNPDRQFNTLYNSAPSFAQNIAANYEAISQRFGVPIPPELHEPRREGSNWVLRWDSAYDVTGNDITYDLQVATSQTFANDKITLEIRNIDNRSGTVSQRISAAQLPANTYYMRLIARSAIQPGRYWVPARNYIDVGGTRLYGMKKFNTY